MCGQFYVAEGELSCQMYQRSCDLGLVLVWGLNHFYTLTHIEGVKAYGTLTLVAVCGLAPGELVLAMGDAHVYVNHVEPLKLQLKNTPRAFPILHINPEKTDIDSFTMEDFTLIGYNPHQKISMEMAV
eukprot:jgi/Botrbrau1/5030/Bobra.0396s0043.1